MFVSKKGIAIIVAAYILVPTLLGGNSYIMSLIIDAMIIGGVALAWALLGNLGGMVSFGHSAFFGVGAYTSAILSMQSGFSPLLGILLGGVGAVIASFTMLPVLRLRGPYFALAILAYAHIFKIIATEWRSLTNGASGLFNIDKLPTLFSYDLSSKSGNFLVIFTILLIFIIIYRLIRSSHYGIALRAIHDSEDATRIVGVNSVLLKALMLFMSAFMTGVVGAFNAHYISFLEPSYAFSSAWVTLPLVAAIFGGYRSILGPLLGAVTVYLLDQLVFKSLIPSGHQIVLGILLVAMIIFSPAGMTHLWRQYMGKGKGKSAKGEKHA